MPDLLMADSGPKPKKKARKRKRMTPSNGTPKAQGINVNRKKITRPMKP